MTKDLNALRAILADIETQIARREKEIRELKKERSETRALLAAFEKKIARFEKREAQTNTRRLTNADKILTVLQKGPVAGLKTDELKKAIDREFGGDIKQSTLSSMLTQLGLKECVERSEKQRWQFRKPLPNKE